MVMVIVCCLVGPSSLVSGQNLIQNGGFGTASRFSTAHWVNANTPGLILNPLNGLGVAILDQDSPTMQQTSQIVPTVPGVAYQLSFASRAPQWRTPEWLGYSSGDQPIGPWVVNVTINSSLTGGFENNSMTRWEYFTNWFVATSATTKIGFYENGGFSGWPFLTDVRLIVAPLPPTLSCPEPLTLECANGAVATLQVQLEDGGGYPVTAVWIVDGTAYQTNRIPSGGTNTSTNLTFSANFQTGEHLVVVSASNGNSVPAKCSTVVTVRDTIPPQLTHLSAAPNVLWPPNHQMVPIRIHATAIDNCGPTSCRVVSVRSNESERSPGRQTREADWQIIGDLTVNLRAERSGQGSRIYTIVVECEDVSGNKSLRSVAVTVPHDRARRMNPSPGSLRKAGIAN